MEKKSKENKTFKNINRTIKQFELGTLVLHKQLQVSTGPGTNFRPKFTGPYVIIKLNPDGCSAIIEHLKNNSTLKAHFSNLQKFNFSPKRMPLPSEFLEDLKKAVSSDTEQTINTKKNSRK